MSASKRDFTDFDAFPGSIIDNIYEFPCLWHKDVGERWRQWHMFVRLIKPPKKEITSIDWELLQENQLDIDEDYLSMGTKLDEGIIAEAWVETGIEHGKITRTAPSYFTSPVNEGKANERNAFQQALIWGRSQWLKKVETGSTESKSEKTKKSKDDVNVMYYPMLAKKFKDGEKHLEYPLYIQPKLDGVRCLVFLKNKNGGEKDVVAYTRTRKAFPSADHIKNTLYPYLNQLFDEKTGQSIYLDGELYKHGKKLQEISGDSRNEKADTSKKNKSRNEYHIYDCFYPNELDTSFEDRHEQLQELLNGLPTSTKTIKAVPTELVESYEEAEEKFDKYVKMGYEGAILRNVNGPYLASVKKTSSSTRSNDLVKMKQKFTDEYKVIDFTEGRRGKDKGAVIWVCQTESGTQFNVTPKDIDYDERYRLFSECTKHFVKKYKNRMLTVEYEDLSSYGVPQRAKALTFRDYE